MFYHIKMIKLIWMNHVTQNNTYISENTVCFLNLCGFARPSVFYPGAYKNAVSEERLDIDD